MRRRRLSLGAAWSNHHAAVPVLLGCCLAALLSASLWARGAALDRADGAAVLVLVEDGRGEEPRADAIVLAQWFRRCDAMSITSIPRDLVLRPGEEPVAVQHHTIGPTELANRLETTFDVSLLAVTVVDVDDVAHLASELGPIRLELPVPSRDRRSGFRGGPGPVELSGERAVEYLRSRAWEEWRGGAWSVADDTDLGRVARLHRYLRGVAEVYGSAALMERLGLAVDALGSAEVRLRDPLGALGFTLGAASHDDLRFHVPQVVEERDLDARRSPFDPDDLAASYRLVLADSGHALPTPCDEDTTP